MTTQPSAIVQKVIDQGAAVMADAIEQVKRISSLLLRGDDESGAS